MRGDYSGQQKWLIPCCMICCGNKISRRAYVSSSNRSQRKSGWSFFVSYGKFKRQIISGLHCCFLPQKSLWIQPNALKGCDGSVHYLASSRVRGSKVRKTLLPRDPIPWCVNGARDCESHDRGRVRRGARSASPAEYSSTGPVAIRQTGRATPEWRPRPAATRRSESLQRA